MKFFIAALFASFLTYSSAATCENDALQATFDACASNLLNGKTSPFDFCPLVNGDSVGWYKCLCDANTSLEICYSQYCANDPNYASVKSAKSSYCDAWNAAKPSDNAGNVKGAGSVATQTSTSIQPQKTNTNQTGSSSTKSQDKSGSLSIVASIGTVILIALAAAFQ